MTDYSALIGHAGAAAVPYRFRPPRVGAGPLGFHPGKNSGSSIDFHDYRSYQPGDDLRRVDWNVYARSDQLVIRRFRSEISPCVEVLLDMSPGMKLYEGKRSAASYTAAFLAAAARNAGGRPVLVPAGGNGDNYGRRFRGNDFEEGLAGVLMEAVPTDENKNLRKKKNKTDGTFDGRLGGDAAWGGGSRDEGGPATLPNMAALRQGTANSVRILISDFMFPSGLENFLFTAGRNASALIVIRVLAQIEREPHFYGGFRFFDAANPRLWKDLRVDPDSVTRYKDRLHAHLEILGQACRKMRAITINLDVPDSFSGLQAVQDAVTLPLMEKGLVGIY